MLVVEPVRDGDLDPVSWLAYKALQEQYDADWLSHHAKTKEGTFLVARDIPTNRIVGFALADKNACESHLLAIAVDGQRTMSDHPPDTFASSLCVAP